MKKRSKSEEACLVCGKTPVQARGLCATHHTRFHRQKRQLNSEEREVFEQTLIDRGLLLTRKSPGRQVEEDEFRDIADELFVAELKTTFEQQQTSQPNSQKAHQARKRAKNSSSKNPARKKKK